MAKTADRTASAGKSDQEKRFTTLQRAISVATREQGPDPEENFRLRLAMRRAEAANMPEEQIEAARRRGSGEEAGAGGAELEETTFEGYGPDGVAVFVEAITEDRRRTEEQLEAIFERHGGSLGEEGCVAWQFERRGLVKVDARGVEDEDTFMLEVIEMGADELKEPLYEQGEAGRTAAWRVFCEYPDLRGLARQLQEAGHDIVGAEPVREATQTVELSSDRARNFMSFYEEVKLHEDVQNVYANWDIA